MGIDRTVRLETFIKIPTQYETGTTKEFGCLKHGVMDSKFCPVCGLETTHFIKEHQYSFDYYDIFEDNLGEFKDGDFTYLYSNYIGTEIESNELYEITPEYITKKISEFKNIHKSDIEKIESFFNIECEIKFGLLYHIY